MVFKINQSYPYKTGENIISVIEDVTNALGNLGRTGPTGPGGGSAGVDSPTGVLIISNGTMNGFTGSSAFIYSSTGSLAITSSDLGQQPIYLVDNSPLVGFGGNGFSCFLGCQKPAPDIRGCVVIGTGSTVATSNNQLVIGTNAPNEGQYYISHWNICSSRFYKSPGKSLPNNTVTPVVNYSFLGGTGNGYIASGTVLVTVVVDSFLLPNSGKQAYNGMYTWTIMDGTAVFLNMQYENYDLNVGTLTVTVAIDNIGRNFTVNADTDRTFEEGSIVCNLLITNNTASPEWALSAV